MTGLQGSKSLFSQSTLHNESVTCFSGSRYSSFFFVLYFQNIKQTYEVQCTNLSCEMLDIEEIKRTLSMSFLNQKMFYWCSNISALEAKKKKALLSFLQSYTGPHSVSFFVENKERITKNNNWHQIAIPDQLEKKDFTSFFSVLFPLLPYNKLFADAVYKKTGSLSLDKACLLMQYMSVISKEQTGQFVDSWLDTIVVPDQSLFTLSTYFFAKKIKPFLISWSTLSRTYPPLFWVSFWSEQLFRARYFVEYAHKKQFVQAKKIGYRLPFTFIKNDWKQYSPAELSAAHDFLYSVDYGLKNGNTDFGLDLFYYSFLFNDFRVKS